MMYRNLSPRALGFSGSIQSEMIELALTYGFKGMDIDVVDFAQQVADFGMPLARRLIDSAKLQIGNFVLPVALSEDEAKYKADMAKLPALAALAVDLGCTRCYAPIQAASDTLAAADNFEQHRKRLVEISDLLQPHNISLGLEFLGTPALRTGKQHPFIFTLPEAYKLVEAVNRPNVGLLIDLWHLYASGGKIDDIKSIPVEKIISVQVSDAPAGVALADLHDQERKLPNETKLVDAIGAVKLLNQLGYTGPVTPEPLRHRMKGMGRQKAVKLVGDAMVNIWREAGLPLGIRQFNAQGEIIVDPAEEAAMAAAAAAVGAT